MTIKDRTLFDELRAKGEEFFTRMSGELMSNPNFTRAMQAAWWTKEKLDQAVAQALKTMRIPTREEFQRVLRRLEQLESEVEQLKEAQRAPRAEGAPRRAARASAHGPAAKRKPVRSRSGRAGAGGDGPAED
jgi:hypothetical protein